MLVTVDGKEFEVELAGETGGSDIVRRTYIKDGKPRTMAVRFPAEGASPEKIARSTKPLFDEWEAMDMEQADLPF